MAVDVSEIVVAGSDIWPISELLAAVAGVKPLFRNTRKIVAALVPKGSHVIVPKLPPCVALPVMTSAVVPVPSLAMFAAVSVAQADVGVRVNIGAKFGIY